VALSDSEEWAAARFCARSHESEPISRQPFAFLSLCVLVAALFVTAAGAKHHVQCFAWQRR
jgi:hypothetical protein